MGLWLLLGVLMFLIQILLGGVTRLTGSGLSITEWKPIHGIIPPLSRAAWEEEFKGYKLHDQYRLVNSDMTLDGFKKIFWWEFIHRFWGRLTGIAFLLPFAWFLWKRQIDWLLGQKLILLFLLGAIQGVIGWLMVASGLLPDTTFVNPVKLSVHLGMAALLVSVLLWVALQTLSPPAEPRGSGKFRNYSIALLVLVSVQVIYGGLMAGHHAALYFPTWPKMGGAWFVNPVHPGFSLQEFFYNVTLIQTTHRCLAYLILLAVLLYWFRFRKTPKTRWLGRFFHLMPLLVLLQVTLGVLTLLFTQTHLPILLAELHQLTGLTLLFVLVTVVYQTVHAPKEVKLTGERPAL